ncbi:MAG: AsmA family protein [Rhodomicrobium sp.]|nr:AsmA family protein [Rhodomicrobium sp.]
MGSLLAALATIIVTALAALLALPYVVDWNEYKAQFETHAAKLVGRPVHIEGRVDLKFLPVPILNLRGVRIADEFGKFEQPFAEVEEINAVLALPPLLSGTIEAKSIDLDQPIVRLKIDEFGEGSWLSVGPYGFDIPLPVRQVILDRVGIKDGAIELRRPRQTSASRIDRISGTFSAESLSGPFRFAGTGAFGDGEKEIKISAGTLQPGASVRVKASLRSVDGVSLYQLDGDIKGLDGQLHYVGPVAARLALNQEAMQAKTTQLTEPMAGRAVEMRASAKLTLDDAKFDDIVLTLTRNDRPQSLNGTAYASWGAAPRLDMSIETAWLDFDQMLRADGAEGRATPAAAIAVLPRLFEGWFFKPRQGEIKAKIQQASFGGDVIEGLDFIASHDDSGWRIDTLTARLPGETDIDIHGALPAGDHLAFNGNFTLKGANLSRLMRWAAPSLGVVDAGAAQNFSLSSGLTLTPAKLAFQEAKGSLGESSFSFDLVHDSGTDSRLLLALDSQRLDLRPLYAAHGAPAKARRAIRR